MPPPNDDPLATNAAARQAVLANLAARRAAEEAAARKAMEQLAMLAHNGSSRRQGGGRYTMRRSRRGCQVVRGRKTFSKKPIACARAKRQIRLLRAVERGWKPSRKTQRRGRK